MPNDTLLQVYDVTVLLDSADENLNLAEIYFESGEEESAADLLEKILEDLLHAGYKLTSSIPKADLSEFENTLPSILRTLAERFGVLPENFAQVFTAVPKASEVVSSETLEQANEHMSVPDVTDFVQNIYTAELSEFETISEEEASQYISSAETLIAILKGQRSLHDGLFSDEGVYDSFCDTAIPYLVTGALFITGEDAYDASEKVPMILHGPMKRLIMLLASLMTSAFMSGLLLLIMKRVLAFRKLRPGIIDNVVFAGSIISLILTNIPMFIEGMRAVLSELRKLQKIIETENSGTDVPVA